MTSPCYIDREQARAILAELGIELTERQMKRAAEMEVHGRRRLPFFLDPIDGKLKINKQTMIGIYKERQVEAETNCQLVLEP